MKSRLAYALMVVMGMVGARGLQAAQGPDATAPEAATGAGATNAPRIVARSVFMSFPSSFGSLERAPVLFPHDVHTRALTNETCTACHPVKDGTLTFSFPVKRDEHSRRTLMNAYHDACLACHNKRLAEGAKSGPITCGECHADKKAYHDREYLPPLPTEYDALRDPYHKNCFACHAKPGETLSKAESLDWKTFAVQARRRMDLTTPEMVFDYVIHDKHAKALDKKCELCHYLSADAKAKLDAAGKQPTPQDWLREEEPGKHWQDKDSAHVRCLNCHVQRATAKQKAGPVSCGECHVSRALPGAALATIQVPDYGQQRVLIRADQARLPGVPFDHKTHVVAGRSCQDCHHATLESCDTCHTLTGAKEGKFVTLAEAYHTPGSTWSCVGCHDKAVEKNDCAGCHHLRGSGMADTSCAKCHTGKIESLDQVAKLPAPASLFPTDLKDELVLSTLEKDYEPVKVQHKKIASKLTEISNGSKLAGFFHKDETTVCVACHHVGPVAKGQPVAPCATCHTARGEPFGNTPALLGAYHQACLGCHQKMAYPEKDMPQQCEGCHRAKARK